MAEIFAEMAQNGLRRPHGDGTGALFLKEGKPMIFKTLSPAWDSVLYLRGILEWMRPEFCIMHARKASEELKRISERAITISSVHPFSSGPWYVFLNGTIKSLIREISPGEFSDTAGAAEVLEKEGIGGLIDVLRREGVGSNFFIYNEEEGRFYVIHSEPKKEDLIKYYTLYAGEDELLVISSEENKYAEAPAQEVLEVEYEGPSEEIWIYSREV